MTKADFFTELHVALDTITKQRLYTEGFRCFAEIGKEMDPVTKIEISRALRQASGETITITDPAGVTTLWAVPPPDICDRTTNVDNGHPIELPPEHALPVFPTEPAIPSIEPAHVSSLGANTTIPVKHPPWQEHEEAMSMGNNETTRPEDGVPIDLCHKSSSEPPPSNSQSEPTDEFFLNRLSDTPPS